MRTLKEMVELADNQPDTLVCTIVNLAYFGLVNDDESDADNFTADDLANHIREGGFTPEAAATALNWIEINKQERR